MSRRPVHQHSLMFYLSLTLLCVLCVCGVPNSAEHLYVPSHDSSAQESLPEGTLPRFVVTLFIADASTRSRQASMTEKTDTPPTKPAVPSSNATPAASAQNDQTAPVAVADPASRLPSEGLRRRNVVSAPLPSPTPSMTSLTHVCLIFTSLQKSIRTRHCICLYRRGHLNNQCLQEASFQSSVFSDTGAQQQPAHNYTAPPQPYALFNPAYACRITSYRAPNVISCFRTPEKWMCGRCTCSKLRTHNRWRPTKQCSPRTSPQCSISLSRSPPRKNRLQLLRTWSPQVSRPLSRL